MVRTCFKETIPEQYLKTLQSYLCLELLTRNFVSTSLVACCILFRQCYFCKYPVNIYENFFFFNHELVSNIFIIIKLKHFMLL